MTIKFQIQTILKLASLTQEKLARELDVSFATLNSWANGKSDPRVEAADKINKLYKKITGEEGISAEAIRLKTEMLLSRMKNQKNIPGLILSRVDIFQQFMLSLTYNSNKIEGSSLSESETATLLFHNRALVDKSLIEQLEVKNHQTALNFVFKNFKDDITEDWILKVHSMLMNGIREDSGSYRNHGVRIVGSFVPTANYLKIPDLMKELIKKIQKTKCGPVQHSAVTHALFEKMHPFSDGNGRVGRLIMTAMLLRKNFPPALIREEKRQLYYTYLSRAQLEGDYSLLEDFLLDAIDESLGIIEL
ncbi:MAG: Fic family protein [Patescibacteria group bacterium]